MKRVGRQHGMVRTYRILPSPWNSRSEPRFVQQFSSPPTAGLFTKVPLKLTNHSKFTGRCGKPRCLGCHMHPACKSKDKTKGTHKLRSRDMVTNSRSINWRVVDGRPSLKFSGFPASRILDHLSNDYEQYEGNDDHDYDDDDDDDDQCDLNNEENIVDHGNDDYEKNYGGFVDDEVKFVLDEDLEEEGWCLVGEI